MYVTANYDTIKHDNPNVPAKELISMIARQWAQVSEIEKEHWKQRAMSSATGGQVADFSEDLADYLGDDELVDMHVEVTKIKKSRGTNSTRKSKSTATV